MQGFDDILVGAPGTDETNRTCDLLYESDIHLKRTSKSLTKESRWISYSERIPNRANKNKKRLKIKLSL
jgi:hypothetical protein